MAKLASPTQSQGDHCRALARHLRARIPSLHTPEARMEFGLLASQYEMLAERLDVLAESPNELTTAKPRSVTATPGAAESPGKSSTRTLGDLLDAGNDVKSRVSEKDWAALIESVAQGDYRALHALYERTRRLVFTLIMRITNNRKTAEDLTLETFHDIWRQAAKYDAAVGSVVGWLMNLARSTATDRLSLEGQKKTFDSRSQDPSRLTDKSASEDALELMTEILLPPDALWERLACGIARKTGEEPVLATAREISETKWEEVGPGISCQVLATDTERDRVSMLVRLSAGITYPPHTHAGVEELHLLHGELWIDDRKLYPGDYNRASPGTGDKRVWSATGCTCVLMTSSRDVLL